MVRYQFHEGMKAKVLYGGEYSEAILAMNYVKQGGMLAHFVQHDVYCYAMCITFVPESACPMDNQVFKQIQPENERWKKHPGQR